MVSPLAFQNLVKIQYLTFGFKGAVNLLNYTNPCSVHCNVHLGVALTNIDALH